MGRGCSLENALHRRFCSKEDVKIYRRPSFSIHQNFFSLLVAKQSAIFSISMNSSMILITGTFVFNSISVSSWKINKGSSNMHPFTADYKNPEHPNFVVHLYSVRQNIEPTILKSPVVVNFMSIGLNI